MTINMANSRVVTTVPPRHGAATPFYVSMILLSAWYFPFTVDGGMVGFLADDAVYLLMADHYSPLAAPERVVEYVTRMSHLPPFYPLLLGLAGGGSQQLDIAHVVQTLLMILGFAVSARFAWRLSDSRETALALLWLLALAPATLLFSSEIWSEFAYLLLAQGALLLALRADSAPFWWWPCALLCGLAAITRGVGLVLIAALGLTLLLRAPRRAWPALLVAVLPLALTEMLGLGGASDYVEIFLLRNNSLAALMNGLAVNLSGIWHGWLRVFSLDAGPVIITVCALVVTLALGGWWLRLRQCALDAFYAAGYGAVLILWPYPEVIYRLIYPLVPLIVLFAGLGTQALAKRLTPSLARQVTPLPVVLLIACALPDTGTMLWKYLHDVPPAIPGARESRYWLAVGDDGDARRDLALKQSMIEFMRAAGRKVPDTDCIHALDPQAVMFYTRRVSFPAQTGAERSALPICRFHLLLSDRKLADSFRALWQPYEVVLTARTAEGIAGILVRYPGTLPD